MSRGKSKKITKEKFQSLKVGTKVKIAHMVFPGFVAETPSFENIQIRFEEGPWKGRVINAVRSQIEKVL